MPSGSRPTSALRISAGEPGTDSTDRYLATMVRAYTAAPGVRLRTRGYRCPRIVPDTRGGHRCRSATGRRFAPITSAACCGRRSSPVPAPPSRPARSTPTQLRDQRGRGDPRRDRAPARGGPANGHRRGIPTHLVAHGLHLLARRDRAGRGRGREHPRSTSTSEDGEYDYSPPTMRVAAPVTPARDDLRRRVRRSCATTPHADQTPKLTIPSPSMVHYRGGNSSIDPSVYPEIDAFWDDLTAAYAGSDSRRLRARLSLPPARRHEPRLRQRSCAARHIEQIGGDPEHLHEQYIANINTALAGKPDDLVVTTHLCRGNNQSMWVARGRLRVRRRGAVRRPERQRLLSRVRRSSDPARSSRCASCPRASRWCSVWSPPSVPQLEDPDVLKRRIEEASRYRRPRPALPVTSVRLLLDRGGQQAHDRRRAPQARADRRRRRRGLGLLRLGCAGPCPAANSRFPRPTRRRARSRRCRP